MDAAIHLFARRGFDGVSINEIGKEAGVTSQLIYHYFRNGKQGLYREAYLRSFRHVMEASIRHLPPDPDPADPAARIQAIEGLAIFIRNIVTAGGNALDSKENEMLLLGYRETFDPPEDLEPEIMDLLEISASRLRALLVVLLPKVTRLSISLLGSAITGALYHERMITGILIQRRKGLNLSMEERAKFYISYTLRVLGVDQELAPDHPYCKANLDKNVFYLC
ncbi:TetR/AcrR family transcriptional regulator [Mesoterricola silvestris]|uniref:TetR family transcriptional regulator n=1 Tax=Mesoterricola silvestris TaxID=2927979 RepID=A0AA48GRV5_9BACT|nr:TetR/AcrR family transcriptional regulator [Mesoterricola silvestris]BDU74530.1 TetR family transcriptional regulator [Mesoterricola silvestris]